MMGPDKLINTSSSPPIHGECMNAHNTGNNACHPKENSYTRLRKHLAQIRNQTNHGRCHQYEKLSSVSTTAEVEPGPTKAATSKSRLNSLLSLISITTLIMTTFVTMVSASPVFVDNPGLAQFQSGRNIRHLPCIVRKSGRSGVCMFAIDCIKQNGTHLGTCIDRFYFGSCCDIKEEVSLFTPEIGDNSIDQNTISHHFTSESTTMPTSALFKLTTLAPLSNNQTMQLDQEIKTTPNNGSNLISGNTQQDVQRPTTQTTSTTTRPFRTTTTRPQQSTTHKHSHFVIRTTAKPTKMSTASKPPYSTTTRKKPTTAGAASTTTISTTSTTTSQPMLTTTSGKLVQDNVLFEATTPPIKLFTFQTVDTTVATPTEATQVFDFVTTERTPPKTTKPPATTTVPITSTIAAITTTTAPAITTTARTTYKPKPQIIRKPTTTKKPSQNKRTSVKPSRKPLPSTPVEQLRPQIQNTSTTTKPKPSSTASSISTSTVVPSSTLTTSTTTVHKPTTVTRPRPKPTATVTKVPKPTSTNSKATQKPSTSTPATTDTAEADKLIPPTSTATTLQPLNTQSQTPTPTSTPIATTTTTSPPPPTSSVIIMSSTSLKPGLVTWTNVDTEPASPNKPSISDWIPVTTTSPVIHNNNTYVLVTTSAPEIIVSDSTSKIEAVNDTFIFTPEPEMPIILQTSPTRTPPSTSATSSTDAAATTVTRKPIMSTTAKTTTTTTLAPTTTERPSTTRTTTTTTTPYTTNSPLSTAFATELPLVSSTTESQLSSTTDTITEPITTDSPQPNATTPVSSLEGVDYRQVCGRRMFPEPRIVGGSNAAFGRWPWQISLRQWRTSTYLHKCGAALLNENWAITAAHCVDNVPPSDLLLRLGEYDLAEEEEPYGYQERRVQIVASHPQFDPRTFEYDLALLRFYEPVTFQPNIIPVCVPESDEDFIGQTAFVTGWGRLYEDGPLPSVLQEVAVPVINNTICESMYRSAGYIEHIPHIFICAGWKKGGYDSCEGDSGGPMVLQRESDKRFQLGGVISWGIGCAEANQPGVYTRISEFRDWINQILQF